MTMKRIFAIFSIVLVALSACSNKSLEDDNKNPETGSNGNMENTGETAQEYDIYLLIGQSNAAGRGIMLPGDEQPIEGVKIVRSIPYGPCVVMDACQPLNYYSTVRKGSAMQKFNLAGPFAAKLHRETGRQILLIVNARGETSLGNWLPNAGQLTYAEKTGDDQDKWGSPIPQLYGEAVRIVKQVLSQEDIKGELKGILWHQGEADCEAARHPLYEQKCTAIFEAFRKELDLPFMMKILCLMTEY